MAKSPTSKSIIQGIGKPASIGNYTPPVPVPGCTDSNYLEFNPQANVDDGSCSTSIVYGCMDSTMFNYDPLANTSNSSCIPIVLGCTDPNAFNYIQPTGANTDVNTDTNPSSCIPKTYGCTDSLALNHDPLANIDDGTCNYGVPGCMDDGTLTLANDGVNSEYPGFQALNYDPLATVDDGSCTWTGCTDPLSPDYDGPNAQVDDGSCTYAPVYGCTDSNYQEYDPLANTDDGSCSLLHIYGCMDPNALNYYSGNTIEPAGSCVYLSYNIPSCYFSINTGGGPDQNGYPDTLSLIIPTVASGPLDLPPTHFRLEFAGQVNGFQDGFQTTQNTAMTSFDNTLGNTIVLNTSGIDNTSVVGSVLFEWQDVSGTVLYTETVSSGSTPANPPIFSITLGCNNDQPGITNDIPDINDNGVDGNPWSFGDSDGYENYNFDPSANYNNGNCDPIYGCIDPLALDYNEDANLQGGVCYYGDGCTDPNATNYDSTANIDDGSCLYNTYDWEKAIFTWRYQPALANNNYLTVGVSRLASKSPYNIDGANGEPYTMTVEVAHQSLGTTSMMTGGGNMSNTGILDNSVTWTTDYSSTNSYQFPTEPASNNSNFPGAPNYPVTLEHFEVPGGASGQNGQAPALSYFFDGSNNLSNPYINEPSTRPIAPSGIGGGGGSLAGDITGRTHEIYAADGSYTNYILANIYEFNWLPTSQQEYVYVLIRIKSEDNFGNVKYSNVKQIKLGFDTWSVSSGDGTTN